MLVRTPIDISSDQRRSRLIRNLRERIIKLRSHIRLLYRPPPAPNTGHGPPLPPHATGSEPMSDPQMFSHRPARQKPARHHLVNHHHALAVPSGPVLRRTGPGAAACPSPSNTPASRCCQRQRLFVSQAAQQEWSSSRSGCCLRASAPYPPSSPDLHSRHAPRPIQHVLPSRAYLGRVRQRGRRKRHPRHQHVVDIDARIQRRQMQQRPPQHPRAHQQHHRQSDLGYHKPSVQAARALPPAPRSARRSVPIRATERAEPAPVQKADRCQRNRRAQIAGRANPAGPLRRAANCPATTSRTDGSQAPPAILPSTPPQSPSTALSVRHWRINRPRPAPSATRTASSRSRETARASSKLATFTHAISSTRLTAPNSNHSVDRTSSTSGRSGAAMKRTALIGFRILPRQAVANHRQLRSAPGLASRPAATAPIHNWTCASRFCMNAECVLADRRIYIRSRRRPPGNSAGVMPTTV